jgi:organic radical activating enzyme
MSNTEAQLNEIFSSFQGEGLYVGERQTFIRFAGCNLSCAYCDTPQALVLTKEYTCLPMPTGRQAAGTAVKTEKESKKYNNPVSVQQLLELTLAYPKNLIHSVSLTGGEPLLQVDFLKNFLPELRKEKLLVYLETNGVLPKHLEEIIDLVDIVSFDIKLPSATGLSPYWKEHKAALEVAYTKQVFTKVIVTKESKPKEIDEAATLIAEIDPDIPLIIQPVTPHGHIKRPLPEELFAFHAIAKRKLKQVRVIPQVHKLSGLL